MIAIAFALEVLLGSNVRRCELQAEHNVKSFDYLNKKMMSPLQRHIPIKSICHFIPLWFRLLRSTVDEVFVERVRNKYLQETKSGSSWILVRHSYHKPLGPLAAGQKKSSIA